MDAIKNYQEALDYLYSFVDYSLTRNLRYSPEKFNLSRMTGLLQLLGNPQNNYKIIHVAGTKGKGSICAMLNSILTRAGYKAGFYSSPHMIDFNERIRIGDELISQNDLIKCTNSLIPFIDQIAEITTFEITTALAFKYFSDKSVDLAIIEVGMGGRLDATNVVTPIVSVISTISHDHTRILGNTLGKIAFEKAGIIKNEIPVIMSKQKKSAREMIIKIAKERNSEVVDVPYLYPVKLISKNLEIQEFEITSSLGGPTLIKIPLIGEHQIENASTAYAAILELRRRGINVEDEAIREGFLRVQWPGRLEIINKEPLVIIDGAHNPESFRKLKKTIFEYLPNKKIILVFGVSEDKNVKTMLRIIKPVVDTLVITQSRHPRALNIDKIHEIAISLGFNCQIKERVEDAAKYAEKIAGEKGAVITAGSIFVAGAFQEIYLKNDL